MRCHFVVGDLFDTHVLICARFRFCSDIYTDANNDPELKSWFTTFGKYIRRVLQEPGFVMTDECDEQGRVLRQNGKGFFSERYRPHREAWTNAVENWFKACK